MQEQLFDPIPLKLIVEGLIFASKEPLSPQQIIDAMMTVNPEMGVFESEIPFIVDDLNAEYEQQGRSFRIVQQNNGFIFKTDVRLHKWLQHIQHENANRKLTQSAVEALAIIAYKQPVTKPVIDSIRGVDSGHMVRQLLEKGLVEVSGRADTPGRPLLYRTSPTFLSHFGLNSITDLPKPREIDEILKDDEMAEHRQIMLELKAELHTKQAPKSE